MKLIPLLALLLCALFSQLPAQADEKAAPPPGDLRQMMRERQQVTQDVLGMMKEMMDIIKNLDGKPTAAQKSRLSEMMSKLDDIMHKERDMAQHQEDMMNRRQELMKDKGK